MDVPDWSALVLRRVLDAAERQGLAERLQESMGDGEMTVAGLAAVTWQWYVLADDDLFGLGRRPVPRGTFRLVA
ncbi:hypothetical protein ACFWWS_38780, partial [Streptomyces sp. NPDC059083]